MDREKQEQQLCRILHQEDSNCSRKNKYPNLDGENWYRLRLSDNTYGYICSRKFKKSKYYSIYDENSSKYDYVKVVCTDGLNIRKEPANFKNNIIATVTKGTQLFRAEKKCIKCRRISLG